MVARAQARAAPALLEQPGAGQPAPSASYGQLTEPLRTHLRIGDDGEAKRPVRPDRSATSGARKPAHR